MKSIFILVYPNMSDKDYYVKLYRQRICAIEGDHPSPTPNGQEHIFCVPVIMYGNGSLRGRLASPPKFKGMLDPRLQSVDIVNVTNDDQCGQRHTASDCHPV
jgi:hypothetical protein